MSLEVRLDGDAPTHTTPQLMELVLEANPTLAQHSCINSHGPTFGHVMDSTSLPHLLEHMVIDELVRTAPRQTQTFVGTTRWVDRQQRTALVQVSFADDFEALQAVNIALERLNSLIEDYNSLHS